nr:hypothetical protein [Candidatus Coxiella mudrowiae]
MGLNYFRMLPNFHSMNGITVGRIALGWIFLMLRSSSLN